jgi:BMFP domain-containing protein YqiC
VTPHADGEASSDADAQTKLAEAIDDFLGDLEKKFKGISDEILTRLDDMAERCDRLEQEMMLKDATTEIGGSKGEDGR